MPGAFKVIVFSTPENTSKQTLQMKESHFVSKHVFSRKCCGVSQKWWVLELSNLCHCVQHPWKLTSKDFWSTRNERKPLSNQKCVLRKCCGVSQKWWVLELSNLCHCVHPTPENLLIGISGALGMKEGHLLKKNVFSENAVGYLRNSEC